MADFGGARVRARLLTGGFAQAYERFEDGQAVYDPVATFHALFEALAWAHAIDDFIALVWSPRGKVEGYAWRSDPALGGRDELVLVMDGLRYVRNRVHHQWADALSAIDGAKLPFKLPRALKTWAWRPIDQLPTPSGKHPDPRGQAAYESALAGHAAEDALSTIGAAFAFLGSLLDPPIPMRTPPVVVSK